jgi:membrane protease YdiL (CAAX protease family)
MAQSTSLAARIGPHWKGHVFAFDSNPRDPYAAASGWRLLLVAALVEGVLGPRMELLGRLGLEAPPTWVRLPILFALLLALVRWVAGVAPAQLGFRGWSRWSATERSYFVQVLVLATAIFGSIFARTLAAVLGNRELWGRAALLLVVNLLWGLYQELVYRGILQTELVRRWGAVAGVLVANLLYTFGPLHLYHFGREAPLPMFAGIFAIGLFFGVVFQRTGNLWMVGIFHGLGDWFIGGLGSLAVLA